MGMNRQPTAVLGLVLSLAFADSSAHAGSQSWVSGVGSDGNPCTRTAPCLTFAGALVKTAAGGEIDCLDPGSYGAVTITKAVTLDCSATFGLVEVSGTNGINVSAGASDIVIIRGLSFRGGVNGVNFTSGAQLSVERCLINGFGQNGIQINMSSGGSVYVTNTYITGVSNGIVAQTSAGALTVAVNQSIIANPTANGFQAAGGTIDATITNTLILKAGTNSVVGSGGNPQINVDSSTVADSTTAFRASSTTEIRISNNNIYNNLTDFAIASGGAIQSASNNRITDGGTTNPSGKITLK
jgi:hypothetical protein